MQKLKQEKKSRILFFFIALQCFIIIYCACFWGKSFKNVSGKNLALRFYNGVVEIYMPGISYENKSNQKNLCSKLWEMVFPSFKYSMQQNAKDWQEDEQADYEKLAFIENEQLEQMIEENMEQNDKNIKQKQEVKETKEIVADQKDNVADGSKRIVKISRKKLEDFDYLRQNFYQVDNTTTINKEQLDVHKLLAVDMSVDTSVEGPQILIYHTHSQEAYKGSKPGDEKTSVIGLGDKLEKLLEKKGYSVLHHKGKYDVGDRDHAYSNAEPALEKLLEENPSIQVVIDLHRDGVAETTHLVTKLNGKKTAQIMFFNGLSRTTIQGDIASLKNPYIAENLALSFQLELAAKEYYPDFTRRTYLKGYRYNMHMCPKSILVEVGAQTNTYKEAENAMEPLADILSKVLKKE